MSSRASNFKTCEVIIMGREVNYYDLKSRTQELKRISDHIELEQKAKKIKVKRLESILQSFLTN